MKRQLDAALVQTLRRKYAPLARIDLKFRGKDAIITTDKEGNAMALFIGVALPNGRIKGERYSRVLKKDADGSVIKDHWDRKGKVD